MPRKPITRKPERERFKREVVKLILRYGIQRPNGAPNEFRMNSKAGPLDVSVSQFGCDDSPATVFTRFDFAIQGESLCGASVPSGKHNFHFSPGTSCDDALEMLERHFERIQPTSLDEFMDNTALVPRAIVETVLEEKAITMDHRTRMHHRMYDPPYMGQDGLDYEAAVAWFTEHCENRLVYLYDSNPRIRATMDRDGRDVAYTFVHHWLDAYLDCPPKYREQHPPLRTPNNEPVQAG